jgi:hypothetical protein
MGMGVNYVHGAKIIWASSLTVVILLYAIYLFTIMERYILFQAYGNARIIEECKYALLRLVDVYKSASAASWLPKVIIYTDQPNSFSMFNNKLDIVIELLDTATILEWKGAINFTHRVKIEVISHCLAKNVGKMLYMDTDTCCLSTIETIFDSISPSQVFFHVDEGNLSDGNEIVFKKWRAFLKKVPPHILDGAKAADTEMWNAGTIGLHPSHLPLLKKVMDTTDAIFKLFPRHTVEQFAFCYIFQQAGIAISASKPLVFHYWRLKEFRHLLKGFFEANTNMNIEELTLKSRDIFPGPFLLDKIAYEETRGVKGAWRKITRNKWKIPQYEDAG